MAKGTDLLDFQQAMELPMTYWSDIQSKEVLNLWAKLIREEFLEVNEAIDALLCTWERGEYPRRDQAEHLLKELCDLRYVAGGLAIALGMDLEGADADVHASNMSKLGDDGKPIRREDGKVLKGPNYVAPNLHNYV